MGQLSRDSKTGFLKVGVHGVQGISDVTKVEKLLSTRGHFCFLPPHFRCGLRRLGDWTAGFTLPYFLPICSSLLDKPVFSPFSNFPPFSFWGEMAFDICGNYFTHLFNISWPASPLLNTYPREMDTCSQKNLYTNVYSNTVPDCQKKKQKNWKQPKCLSMDEWTNRYIHTMGYYSVNKERNYLYSNNLDRPPRLYAEQMNPISKAYML